MWLSKNTPIPSPGSAEPRSQLKPNPNFSMKGVDPAKPGWKPKLPQSTIQSVTIYCVKGYHHNRHEDMEVSWPSVAEHLLDVSSVHQRHLLPSTVS